MGKGSTSSPPAVSAPDNSAAINTLVGGLSSSMASMMQILSANQAINIPEIPVVEKSTPIDWTEKTKELSSKMKADYALENAQRVGRQDTILSSPLLDNSTPETTKSLLAGKAK
jgi:hypothetical protein